MKLLRAGVLFPAILVAGICGHAAGQDPAAPEASASRDDFVLQYGETVLPIEKAAADAPRQRRAQDPWFEIVRLKKEDKRLVMEFNVVQGKPEWFCVVLKSATGRKVCEVRGGMLTSPFSSTGVLLRTDVKSNSQGLQLMELPDVGERVEAWIEYDPLQPPRPQGFGPSPAGIKVSRSAILGAVGQLTYSRTWTAEEKQVAEKQRLDNAAPPPPPDGHVVISERTKPLIPGMPILIPEAGQWATSELLAIGSNPSKLIVKKLVKAQPTSAMLDRERCAVSSEALKQADSDPSQFKPSLRVFPSSGAVLTKDFELVTPSTNLVQGMAMLSSQSGEGTYAGTGVDGKLRVRMPFSEGRLQSIDRSATAVKMSEAAKLSDPDFSKVLQERYRSYLRLVDREADLREETEDVRKKLQPPRAAVGRSGTGDPPPGMTPLTTNEIVPARLPVMYRDTSRWWVAFVEEDSPEGRVDIRVAWPSPGQELRASRKSLFVRREVSEGAAHQQTLISRRSFATIRSGNMHSSWKRRCWRGMCRWFSLRNSGWLR